jgi:hypothetical protein
VPNVTVVVGIRDALVVDTGLGAHKGRTVMREVEKVSKPVRALQDELQCRCNRTQMASVLRAAFHKAQ